MKRLTGDHDGLGVPSQTVFQKPSEDRVSVGDEAVSSSSSSPPPRVGEVEASPQAALPLAGHAVDTLAAVGHLGVLGCRGVCVWGGDIM